MAKRPLCTRLAGSSPRRGGMLPWPHGGRANAKPLKLRLPRAHRLRMRRGTRFTTVLALVAPIRPGYSRAVAGRAGSRSMNYPQTDTRPPRSAAHGWGRSGRGAPLLPYGRDPNVRACALPLHPCACRRSIRPDKNGRCCPSARAGDRCRRVRLNRTRRDEAAGHVYAPDEKAAIEAGGEGYRIAEAQRGVARRD
jgi:hypothetical protein